MSVSSVSFNTDVNIRYDRLSNEYAKLRSHAKVLSEGIIAERKKSESLSVSGFLERCETNVLQESVRELEVKLRKLETENESLTFRNDQLVKRVEMLQDELEASAHIKTVGTKEGRLLKKLKDTKNLFHDLEVLESRVSVLEEELQDKIRQNMELTVQISDLKQRHAEEVSSLLNEIAREVEKNESRLDSDRAEEHKPGRPMKSVKPFEPSLEICDAPSITPSSQPPPISEAYLQVAESIRNTLQGLSTLFELLYQRTQIYPFDASMEALPNHVKKLSSGMVQCSQLLAVPIDLVEQCIMKAEFQWSTDVPRLHSSLNVFVKHCNVIMPELLKQLAIEENKITWCNSQVEELNFTWCDGFCRLFAAVDSVCNILAGTSCSFDVGEELCTALDEGAVVIKELDVTFSTRWALESRFPTATKRICCIGITTSHCLSRLVNETSKLAARAHAVNELYHKEVDNDKQNSTFLERTVPSCDFNLITDGCGVTEENSTGVEKQLFCSRGVDTSDLDSQIIEPSDTSCAPSNSSEELSSKLEIISEEIMIDFLKSKVSELESEREGHLVDLSLLRRKLAHLGAKEVKDDSYSEIEMLKQVNRERLRAVTDDLQRTQCTANYYKGECAILLRKNLFCTKEKRILEDTVQNMTQKVATLTDELASVRRSYDEQLLKMTEHIADLNGKIAEIEREKEGRRCPPAQQRGGLKSLFMK